MDQLPNTAVEIVDRELTKPSLCRHRIAFRDFESKVCTNNSLRFFYAAKSDHCIFEINSNVHVIVSHAIISEC